MKPKSNHSFYDFFYFETNPNRELQHALGCAGVHWNSLVETEDCWGTGVDNAWSNTGVWGLHYLLEHHLFFD